MKNIILLGPPGAGKGTQSANILENFNYIHLSTGDLIRTNIVNKTHLGKICQAYSEKGQLVPDDIMIEIVKDYLSKVSNNVVWDGFPRTVIQAKKLDDLLANLSTQIDLVINLDIDKDLLKQRIIGRRVCLTCGTSYHVNFAKPKVDNVCDKDQTTLTHRKDDTEEKFEVRYQEFIKGTKPLVDYYSLQNKLINIDANKEFHLIWNEMKSLIENI
ncbi:adenylate kinase [Spiroplasma endosymbiont of Anurida maritima]|uniref:adenylate kinase n=1 Tax=Spiroplasma endosymbiont of Anurida maritima TaxID=2967972 RepID=UPI0036D32B34